MTGRPVRAVVVGAGSAGAVVAARWSEHPAMQVTLLEAGPDHTAADTPPSISGASFLGAVREPGRTWPALEATRASGQPARPYTRGRGVGGSSAVNAMVALLGAPADYDAWERELGCEGWGWKRMAPWFQRTQLTLSRAPRGEWGEVNRAVGAWWSAAADGVPLTRDAAGRRVSVNDAYLEPARRRPNLTVVGDSLVDRVLFRQRRAVGVRTVDGREYEADVVAVCAGAIHTPAVLLRSGVDTPGVGEGLADHASFPIAITRREPARAGSLVVATVARLPGPEGADDLQLLPLEYVDPDLPGVGMVMAAVMRVHSRGTVRLSGADAALDPVVHQCLLDDERDLRALHRAVDEAERMLATAAFAAVGEPVPYDRSDAGLRAGIGDYVHAAGTCALGTVVDLAGWLRGYDGVLVCDASVLPALPRANTHLPTVAVAERLAAEALDRLRPSAASA